MSSHAQDPVKPKRRRRISKFRLDEISLVDNPAHGPARIAILKRAADTVTVEPIQKNRLAMTTFTGGHSHSIVLISASSEGMAELKAGQTSFADGHVHDWIMDDAGNILISDAEGHSHGLSALVKADESITNEILAEGFLASLASDETQASATAEPLGESGDITMSKKEKVTEETVITPEELAKSEQRAERAEQIVKLSPEQRAHFDGLESEGQGEFLKSEDKDAIVKNATEADPVVYTSRDGDRFLKSDDQRLVKAAQRADKAEERVEKSEKLAKRAGFEKQAGEELKHLTGEIGPKADLLEAIETLPVEKREDVTAILLSKDAGMAKAFETLGTSNDGNGEGADAHTLITGIAKGLMENDSTLSPERAYTVALDTPEGLKLHSQLAGS
jgi:hypothetical protein